MSSGRGLGSSHRWRHAGHCRSDHVPGASQYRSRRSRYRIRPSAPHRGQAGASSTATPSLSLMPSGARATGDRLFSVRVGRAGAPGGGRGLSRRERCGPEAPHDRRGEGPPAQADPRRARVPDGDAPLGLAGVLQVRTGVRHGRVPGRREGVALPQGPDGQLHRPEGDREGRVLRQPPGLADEGRGGRVLPRGAEPAPDPDPAARRPRVQGDRRRGRVPRERAHGAVPVRGAGRVPDPRELAGHPVRLGRRHEVSPRRAHRNRVLFSPTISRCPFGRRPSAERTSAWRPIRLFTILCGVSITASPTTIEASMSAPTRREWSPIDVYGPTYVPGPITQSLPIPTGPRTTLSRATTVPAPICTRPRTCPPSSTRPSFRGSMSSRIRWFASRMSSGRPVSFHQPFTVYAVTRAPDVRRLSIASVISSSR